MKEHIHGLISKQFSTQKILEKNDEIELETDKIIELYLKNKEMFHVISIDSINNSYDVYNALVKSLHSG